MAAVCVVPNDPLTALKKPPSLLLVSDLRETADKVESIYRGFEFKKCGRDHPVEECFRDWKWKGTRNLIKEFLKKQGDDTDYSHRILEAVNRYIQLTNKILPSVDGEREKRVWMALRHALIKIKLSSYNYAKTSLSENLAAKKISEEDYSGALKVVDAAFGAEDQDDFYIERGYRFLFPHG